MNGKSCPAHIPAHIPTADTIHNHTMRASISESYYDTVESATEPDQAVQSEDVSFPGPFNQLGLPEYRCWDAYHPDALSCGVSVPEEKGEHWFDCR
jgi:hypothetical protein